MNQQTLHTFVVMFKGRTVEVKAASKYEAQEKGAAMLGVRKSYQVITMMVEDGRKPGEPVIHSTLD
jgi:hypothetical protein